MTGPSNRPLIERLVADLAASSGSAGFTIAEITAAVGCRPQRVHTILTEQIKAGAIWRGAKGHRTVRFFGRAEWADTYGKRHRRPATGSVGLPRSKAPWAADAPIHYPVDADGNPTYKFTRCPTPQQPDRIRTGWGCGQTITQGGPIV